MTLFKISAVFVQLTVCVSLFSGLLRLPAYAMAVDLGGTNAFIKVTPEYSEAALTAVLPFFSDVAQKLNLPVPNPITREDIKSSHVLPFRDLAVTLKLKNGWAFSYKMGHVDRIVDTHGYSVLQDPDKIPLYYGAVRMTTNGAVKLARDVIGKIGITNGMLFTDQEPKVTGPEKIGTNTVAHYEVAWINPEGGLFPEIDVHINASTRNLESVTVATKNFRRFAPRLTVAPIPTSQWPLVNPEYAHLLIPMILQAIGSYSKNLSLPIPLPLTTNNVSQVRITDNGGWPDCDVVLTNGWRFVYRHTMVNGYFSPNVLLTDIYQRPFRVSDFEGKWNMNTNQAIELVKEAIANLGYATNNIHLDFAPVVDYMADGFKMKIPRFTLLWEYKNPSTGEMQSLVRAEVNADTKVLESFYYDDTAYWGSRPPINVPISIKH